MQLDQNEEMGPKHGICGTLDAELRVQGTSKWAEMTAFLCLLTRIVGTTSHVHNERLIDGLGRRDMKCLGPKAKDADLWIFTWEEVHRIHQEGILLEVENVKAHRSKKEKQEMSLFQRMIEDGKESADELYGTLDAAQRTTKRAELTAFLCLFRGIFGSITAHVDNKGTIGEGNAYN